MRSIRNPERLSLPLLRLHMTKDLGLEVDADASLEDLLKRYRQEATDMTPLSMEDKMPASVLALPDQDLSSQLGELGATTTIENDGDKQKAQRLLFELLCGNENGGGAPPSKKSRPNSADADGDQSMPDASSAQEQEEERKRQAVAVKEQGNQMYKQHKFHDALKLYTEAIELDGENPSFYNNRAACYISMNKFQDALKDAEVAISKDPANVKYNIRAAKAYVGLGRLSDARRHVQASLDAQPKNKQALEELEKLNKIEWCMTTASQAVVNKHFNNALSILDQALALAPSSEALKLRKSEIYLLQGSIGDADRLCSGIIRANNLNVDALCLRARCFLANGDMDQASAHLRRAVQLNPDHKESRELFKKVKKMTQMKQEGNDAFKQGDLDKAYQLYSEALELDATATSFNSKLYLNRAIVSAKLGKNEEAVADCDKALELDDTYTKARLKRAELNLALENFEEAVRDYQNASDNDPSNRDLRDKLRHAKLELKKSKRKDYYKMLGVAKDANDHDIKKAYRKAALRHHPDRVQGDEAKAEAEKQFKELGEAYAILSDPRKRARYDRGDDLEDDGPGGFRGHGHGMDMHDLFFAHMFAQRHPFGGGGFGGPFGGGGFSGFDDDDEYDDDQYY